MRKQLYLYEAIPALMPCFPYSPAILMPLRRPLTATAGPVAARPQPRVGGAGQGLGWLISGGAHLPIVHIQLAFGGRLLTARWLGNSTPENVLKGVQQLFRLVGRYHAQAVLSDGSGSSGDWSDVLPLIEYELLPLLDTLGLRWLALVSSSFAPSQMALHELAQAAQQHPITTRLFDHPAPAQRWVAELLTEA